MNFSKYQVAIFDAVTTTANNLVVEAVAGSGKTTTIVEAANRTSGSVIFLAFNKHIAEELRSRLPMTAQAATMNSFGWGICRNAFKNVKLDANKTQVILRNFTSSRDFFACRSATTRLVSLFKANCLISPSTQDCVDIADRYGIDIPKVPNYVQLLMEVYQSCLSTTSIMDFDDQIFMPVYKNLPVPTFQTAIVDESQDLNPIQIELFLRIKGRAVAVGDTRQAIYGFRGADVAAMRTLVERTQATKLPLSVCYRCGINILKQAKEIVPEIEWPETAIEGINDSIKTDDFRRKAETGDFVLCRTTAPLVSECLRFIREGKKAVVKGRDIGQNLKEMVEKIGTGNMDIPRFVDLLKAYQSERIAQLSKVDKEDQIVALNDRIETILVFCETANNVFDILTKIDSIFTDNVSGVVFCTVHKSKGLEADRVFILRGDLLPHPAAKQEHQKEQERNLKYVAITRARKELYWVR